MLRYRGEGREGAICSPDINRVAHLEKVTPVDTAAISEKARLILAAVDTVVDLGTSLRTASNYLVTTERPALFRDAVLRFLAEGGRYRCVLMDPECEATRLLSQQRGERLADKTRQAMAAMRRFKDRFGVKAEGLEVYQSAAYPAMACMAVDHDQAHGVILASPYLIAPPGSQYQLERGDMPHLLVARSAGPVYDNLSALMAGFAYGQVDRVI